MLCHLLCDSRVSVSFRIFPAKIRHTHCSSVLNFSATFFFNYGSEIRELFRHSMSLFQATHVFDRCIGTDVNRFLFFRCFDDEVDEGLGIGRLVLYIRLMSVTHDSDTWRRANGQLVVYPSIWWTTGESIALSECC